MYDNDLADIEEIGWDRFIYGAWEGIYLAYRSAGVRSIGRRWSDLLQAGLGCTQELADVLVRDQVIVRQDRDLMAIKDPERLLAAMAEVLADIGSELGELAGFAPADRASLLAAHQRLADFLQANF
jgi:hypothetical protein